MLGHWKKVNEKIKLMPIGLEKTCIIIAKKRKFNILVEVNDYVFKFIIRLTERWLAGASGEYLKILL